MRKSRKEIIKEERKENKNRRSRKINENRNDVEKVKGK